MLLRSLLVVCCCALVARAEDPKPVKPTLPEWHGTWEGALLVRTPGGKTLEVPVELKIEPIKGSNELTWKFIYHDAAKTIKDYKLVPDAKSAERFVIDECNTKLQVLNAVMLTTIRLRNGNTGTTRRQRHALPNQMP